MDEELMNHPLYKLPLLVPLAKQLEKTTDPEARQMLKMGMGLIIQAVSPEVRRAEIVALNGGQDEPEQEG